jgi:hypothetical protein
MNAESGLTSPARHRTRRFGLAHAALAVVAGTGIAVALFLLFALSWTAREFPPVGVAEGPAGITYRFATVSVTAPRGWRREREGEVNGSKYQSFELRKVDSKTRADLAMEYIGPGLEREKVDWRKIAGEVSGTDFKEGVCPLAGYAAVTYSWQTWDARRRSVRSEWRVWVVEQPRFRVTAEVRWRADDMEARLETLQVVQSLRISPD